VQKAFRGHADEAYHRGMGRRTPRSAQLGAALLIGASTACNLLTGADSFVIGDGGSGGETSVVVGPGTGGGPGAGTPSSTSGATPTCGDAFCAAGESCTQCPEDCGACPATCPNGTCDAADETCTNCPEDCGMCAPTCGDMACNGAETCSTCPGDCGMCAPMCGDATCNAPMETCVNCPADCGACNGPVCGDAACNGSETCMSCASDCGACATCQGASDTTTALDAEETAFVGLLNTYRAQNGLGAVSACVSLNRAAQGHSEDMRDNDYFSHDGLNGSTPWARSCDACFDLGCGPQTAMAENIAAGNSGAQATFNQWKNSPGHNANMLGASFTIIGIGRATGGGTYGVYWTNVFGGQTEPSCN
jgi:uncharacterized protein YkwD